MYVCDAHTRACVQGCVRVGVHMRAHGFVHARVKENTGTGVNECIKMCAFVLLPGHSSDASAVGYSIRIALKGNRRGTLKRRVSHSIGNGTSHTPTYTLHAHIKAYLVDPL